MAQRWLDLQQCEPQPEPQTAESKKTELAGDQGL